MQDQNITYRTIEPTPPTGRPGASHCRLSECETTTREGKPYCSDHIEHSPYIANLIEEIALRDEEEALLIKGKAVDIHGHLVKEALLALKQGIYTSARLARLIDIDPDAAVTLIKLLDRKGLALAGRTERGSLTVRRADSETGQEQE